MSIFKYQRIVTQGPNGTTLYFKNSKDNEAVELGFVDGWYYVFVPINITLPTQHAAIQWQEVEMSASLLDQLKKVSRPYQLINQRVQEAIAERYSMADEIKLLRTAPSDEFTAYNAYVEECRNWGKEQKAKIGM